MKHATTYPSVWRSVYTVSAFNTLAPSVCGHLTSHGGVLLDPYPMVPAAHLPVPSSLESFDDTRGMAEAVLDIADAHGDDTASDTPLSPAASFAAYRRSGAVEAVCAATRGRCPAQQLAPIGPAPTHAHCAAPLNSSTRFS